MQDQASSGRGRKEEECGLVLLAWRLHPCSFSSPQPGRLMLWRTSGASGPTPGALSCLPPRSPHPRHLQNSRSLPDHAYTRIRCTCSPTKERADQAVPYSLLPSPYILHPTPTSNPTPYTLHPAPCSLHATRYSLLPQASRVTSNPTCLCA